jgi:rfaE bifunctional protein nucleotidyltransferase chain/domain
MKTEAGPRNPESLILRPGAAVLWRDALRRAGRRLVVTNGCFDLLHRGHADYLLRARSLGDALLVALNSDCSIRLLKGKDRPLVDEFSRAYLLASLECVDAVVVFDDVRCTELLRKIATDVYVKGGDYTVESLNPDERAVLLAAKTEIRFIPFVDGFSTSSLLAKILNHA